MMEKTILAKIRYFFDRESWAFSVPDKVVGTDFNQAALCHL